METELALSGPPSLLSRRLALIRVRKAGVGPEQLRWIATDPEIFEAFYRQHVEGIQGFVARRVGDPEHAADLTAEVFLAAIGAAHQYRPARGAPKAWLYGIARTVVAADRRQIARQKTREERFRASAMLDENDAAQIEARIEAAAKLRQLYGAMDRLAGAERAILELVAIDELSLTEAATAVGVRPVTARVRLYRARRKLRAELEVASTEPTIDKGGES
jgi:RNA polymerase sigma factor (sigma-70 family)